MNTRDEDFKVSAAHTHPKVQKVFLEIRLNSPCVYSALDEISEAKLNSLTSFSQQDKNEPLTYQFHYKTDRGLYTVVSHGSESHATTVLPSGKQDNDYEIDFEITVTDTLSAAANISRKVKASTKKTFSYFSPV